MRHRSYSQLQVVSSSPPGTAPSIPTSGPQPVALHRDGSLVPWEPRSILLRTLGAVVLAEQPGSYIMGALQNVMIVVWRSQAQLAALEKLHRAADWMTAKCPEGRSSIHIVVDGTPLPSQEAQQSIVELMRRSNVACGAAVYLGSGFWASAHRSSTTQMTMQAQHQFEFRHHQALEELAPWLPDKHYELTGVRLRPERLLSATQAFVTSVQSLP